MNDNEKMYWLSLFILPGVFFGLGFVAYAFDFTEGSKNFGWGGVGGLVVLSVILIFRLTYLAGRKSR